MYKRFLLLAPFDVNKSYMIICVPEAPPTWGSHLLFAKSSLTEESYFWSGYIKQVIFNI